MNFRKEGDIPGAFILFSFIICHIFWKASYCEASWGTCCLPLIFYQLNYYLNWMFINVTWIAWRVDKYFWGAMLFDTSSDLIHILRHIKNDSVKGLILIRLNKILNRNYLVFFLNSLIKLVLIVYIRRQCKHAAILWSNTFCTWLDLCSLFEHLVEKDQE